MYINSDFVFLFDQIKFALKNAKKTKRKTIMYKTAQVKSEFLSGWRGGWGAIKMS